MKKNITLTNIELINAANALQVLCQQEQALNPKFRLTKNKKAIEAQAIEYQDFRTEIFDKLAAKDEDGQIKLDDRGVVLFPTPEADTEARAQLAELNALTVDIEYQPIAINTMTATGVQGDVLEALLWMFEEPD